MNLPGFKRNKGFTIIELMIVVVIISIIAVSSIPAFSSYIKKQNLKQAQEQVRSDLRSTQNKALSGTLSDQLVGGTLMKYWGVQFINNSGSYNYFISASSAPCPPVSYTPQGSSTLPSEIKVTSLSGCLFFSVENGGISTGLPNEWIEIGLNSDTKRVTFNSAGRIF